MTSNFTKKLTAAVEARGGATLCVGLDPDPERFPVWENGGVTRDVEGMEIFLRGIIEATAPHACSFKPNSAFFEAWGGQGLDLLKNIIEFIPDEIPVILDAKRGDIGSTAEFYARAAFDDLGADAVTLSPFLGSDSLEPFLARKNKGLFLLCRTSNKGAAEFLIPGDMPRRIAEATQRWGKDHPAVGLVVGATAPEDMAAIRAICPEAWILAPGVGAQGGDLAAIMRAGASSAGPRTIINASRSISYASPGADWQEAAARAAEELASTMRTLTASPPPHE